MKSPKTSTVTDSLRPLSYEEIDKLTDSQLLGLWYQPLSLLASCDNKLKYLFITDSNIEDLYDDEGQTIGFRLTVNLRNGKSLIATTEIDKFSDMKTQVKAQYKLAEDILNQIDMTKIIDGT